MFDFAPQSSTAITGASEPFAPALACPERPAFQRHAPSPSDQSPASLRETPGTRFAPAIDGADRARSTSSASVTDASSVIAPGTAPASRIRLVSARVSIPAIPSTPCSRRNTSRSPLARKFEGVRASSCTTNPDTCTFADSRSSGFTPVLPISGVVCTRICPEYDGSVSDS